VCGAWFRFGEVTMCKTHLDKTLDPAPFLSSSARSLSAWGSACGCPLSRTPPLGTRRTRPCPALTGLARAGGARVYSADREAGTPLVSLGGRVHRVHSGHQERLFSYNTSIPLYVSNTQQQNRKRKTGNGKARDAKRSECLLSIMHQHRAVRERQRRGPW
jgi:hypothetical protein